MDYRLIALSGRKGAGLYTKVSPEDYDRCMQHSWHLGSTGYPCTNINGKQTKMQLFLTGKKYSDHINHDTLDNRRSNLFAGGQGPNMLNRNLKKKGNTSKYPGVSWHKAKQKWEARTKIEDKYKFLGYFKEELDAAYAYFLAVRPRHPYMQKEAWQTPEFLARLQSDDSAMSI